jgi:hypothetical protein
VVPAGAGIDNNLAGAVVKDKFIGYNTTPLASDADACSLLLGKLECFIH